jgi:hypothetical protein
MGSIADLGWIAWILLNDRESSQWNKRYTLSFWWVSVAGTLRNIVVRPLAFWAWTGHKGFRWEFDGYLYLAMVVAHLVCLGLAVNEETATYVKDKRYPAVFVGAVTGTSVVLGWLWSQAPFAAQATWHSFFVRCFGVWSVGVVFLGCAVWVLPITLQSHWLIDGPKKYATLFTLQAIALLDALYFGLRLMRFQHVFAGGYALVKLVGLGYQVWRRVKS